MGVLVAPAAASAQEATPRAFDTIFRTGTLDALPEGAELRYDGSGMPGTAADGEWTHIDVAIEPGDRAVVEGTQGTAPPRVLGTFDAGVGNPLAMVFLEMTVNAVAQATGGSPTYIRNRMRDALAGPGEVTATSETWEGTSIEATEVVLRPFEDDPHGAALGAFADLTLRMVVSEAVPGWYLSVGAAAPAVAASPGFDASLSLAGAGE